MGSILSTPRSFSKIESWFQGCHFPRCNLHHRVNLTRFLLLPTPLSLLTHISPDRLLQLLLLLIAPRLSVLLRLRLSHLPQVLSLPMTILSLPESFLGLFSLKLHVPYLQHHGCFPRKPDFTIPDLRNKFAKN